MSRRRQFVRGFKVGLTAAAFVIGSVVGFIIVDQDRGKNRRPR